MIIIVKKSHNYEISGKVLVDHLEFIGKSVNLRLVFWEKYSFYLKNGDCKYILLEWSLGKTI